jgi:hypothetical protein
MKKTIAFVLILALCAAFSGCMAKMTPTESFLLATRKMDLAAMRAELTADEKAGSLYTKLQNADLDEETLTALRDLYSLVQYTMGEVSSVGKGEQTVSLTLRVPDMERIRSLVTSQVLVLGASPESILEGMLADGSVSKNMMKEYSVSVRMTEVDGEWKIPYGDRENADFVKALSVAEMIDFLN